jgi:hypothetical protein
MIDVAALRACRFRLQLHARLADGALYQSRCVEHPDFIVVRRSRRGRTQFAYYVGEEELPDLHAVAAALNARADDAAWEAAAPR